MLNPTPPERLTDQQGRPYFLWDSEMTLTEFRQALQDPDLEVRGYLVGKLMRQAKPDDVFTFVSTREIRNLWPRLERYLGRSREFWAWLLEAWSHGDVRQWPAEKAADLATIKDELIRRLLVTSTPDPEP